MGDCNGNCRGNFPWVGFVDIDWNDKITNGITVTTQNVTGKLAQTFKLPKYRSGRIIIGTEVVKRELLKS